MLAPVSDDVLDDLRARLRSFRRVTLPEGVGWERGADADYLADLIGYWGTDFDWRAHEARIHALPWETVAGVRVIHQRCSADAPTVVLLHGWPDSVLRYQRVLPLLTDVNVVVPALPGYPFSAGEAEVGLSSAEIARRIVGALTACGYERAVLSGGDIGGSVAEIIAGRYPERVAALHMSDVPLAHALVDPPTDPSPAEREYLAAVAAWRGREGAYALEQGTKPHTLAVGLGDSPAGLAAWLVEKLRSWSDCDGDVESVFARDDLLTWVTAYWVTGTIGTSFSPYVEGRAVVEQVEAPTVLSVFPHDLVRAPRDLAERIYDLRDYRTETAGGHFAAWEQPDAYVAGVRSALSFASF